MQKDVPGLIRELKKEKCPQRVRDEVRGRIAARESSPRRLRLATSLAFAALVLVCCLSVWRWHAAENARQQAQLAQRTMLARAQVTDQAAAALRLVGGALLDAGARSEKVISDRAVPPLRNSLELAKNKIIHPIEL
jgi:type VI protein secretion system component VasK